MRRLVLLLIPVALFAQAVVADTVIRVPGGVGCACFFPELNKLYVGDWPNGLFVLDCSTYQSKPEIAGQPGLQHCSWDWRDHKLYAVSAPHDTTYVYDVAHDSLVGTLTVPHEWFNDVYLSDIDVRFKPAGDTLFEYERAADTVIRRLPVHSSCASWDSVGHKLYVGQGSMHKLYVYDYLGDSCLKVIDVSAIRATTPDACVFSRTHRRAYVSSFQPDIDYDYVGIVDTDRDTLLRVLPAEVLDGLYRQVAVDEQDGKVYIASSTGIRGWPEMMWVVDCATDSVLRKFEYAHDGLPDECIRWVPWSNRLYIVNECGGHSYLMVFDCNTDSVIVPCMLQSDFLYDIELDTIHRRIFVTGDTDKVFVLHDSGYAAVQETPSAAGRAMNVSPTIVRGVLSLQGATNRKPQAASLLDIAGRKVLDLHPGANDVRALAPGVYFVREAQAQAQAQAVRKVVVTR
jgi:DNA-binding beta-propeller fold protein YncE